MDKQHLEIIAHDFLQIILEKYADKFDEVIQQMSENPPPRYSRWYDENYELHTCIEFIKTLEDNEKISLVNSFIMSLMSFITNVDDE
ncbi:hypothetical protein IJD15_01375 [bacterium]|nr:hypothetical protein [bacterium]